MTRVLIVKGILFGGLFRPRIEDIHRFQVYRCFIEISGNSLHGASLTKMT